jgi:hypothetical protein
MGPVSGAESSGEEVWRVDLGRGRTVRADELPPPLLACVTLIDVMNATSGFVVDTPLQQLVVSTVARSFSTFTAICGMLFDGLPTQAAMLCRPMFEDLVITHWLVLNDSDPAWLVDRFQRHKEAMALYQQKLAFETEWALGPSLVNDLDAVKSRQNALFREFGGEAQKNWWDPGSEGRGRGRPIGLRGVASLLEDAAAEGRRFHPRLAGGDEPLLRRMELVVNKWFTQCLHHTAVGLPINVTGAGQVPELIGDPSYIVSFSAYWIFAQQIYVLDDLYGARRPGLDELIYVGMKEGFGAPESTLKLNREPTPAD